MPKIFDLINKNPDNVAEVLDDDTLKRVSETCLDGYKADLSSREDYVERIDEGIKLATQVIEHKNQPWPNASNVKYPLITEGAMRFSAEAYPRLIDGLRPVKGRIIGEDPEGVKRESAQRVGRHMSWQILEQMEEWEEDMDRLLILVSIVGTMFKKTYYDGTRNRSDVISPKNLVVNYHTQHLDSAPRITHQLFFSENEVIEKQRAGTWLDVDLGVNTGTYSRQTGEDLPKSTTGFDRPAQDEDAPRLILEEHTWADLDGDDYKEPWIITIDEATGTVLRIIPRFDETSVELDAQERVVKITPDQYFTKFSFVPNPDRSIYDLGLYHLAGPLNETANTLINQLVDAGTLSNLQSGFISKGLRIRGGSKRFQPGEWKPVNATYDDIKKGIFPLPVREPSNVLLELLGIVIQSGQRLTSTQDALAGTSEQHNQKTGAAEQNVRQGMKVFNGIYKRLHRALKNEFKKLYQLNARYLDGTEYFTVLDADIEVAPEQTERGQADIVQRVVAEDYDPDNIDVIPSSSPNIESEQEELQKASSLFSLAEQGLVNPQVATKRILEAQEQPGVEELLKIPEAQPSFDQKIELAKLELEQEKAKADYEIELAKAKTDKFKALGDVLKNVAQAEGEEKGKQLDAYKIMMDALAADADEEIKREQARTRPSGVRKPTTSGGSDGRSE